MSNHAPTPTKTTPPSASTQAVHAGEARFRSHHSLTVPIVQTAVYTFENTQALVDYAEEHMFWDEPQREEYGRYGNPTVRAVEAKLTALDQAQDAVLVSSGMAAVTSTLLLLLSPGQHFILTDNCYHSTLAFSRDFLKRFGIECSLVPCGDYEAIEAAVQPNTRLILSESPTNPFMRCVDYERLVAIAKRHKLVTAIDTTFATPFNVQPLTYGVDLVIHSITKYLSGHNDLMAGAVLGKADLTTRLRQMQGLLGNIVAPQTAYLILRGIKTLALRVERQNASGLAVARFLADQPKVRTVWYPGLESHPDHAVATATMHGFGGVVSFEIDGDAERTYRFIDALQIPTIGPSLGGVESMVSPLAVMGYANIPPEEREALGIRDELVRLCLGIEDADDLIADLRQALDKIQELPVSELRQNLATKEWVIIALERAKRPHEFVDALRAACGEGPEWDARCPFCPGNEEEDLDVLRVPAKDPWRVRIVGNRYPALSVDDQLERQYIGLLRRISGVGYHEVIVESPRHNICAALQSPEDVSLVFRTFIERAWQVQTDRRIEYVLFFKNHGRNAGASLLHPHAQMVALPMVPNEVRVRADEARHHFDEVGRCAFCEMVEQELQSGARLILETKHFVAFTPYASVTPFHIWVVPKAHLSSFLHAQDDELADLGVVMYRVLRKLYLGLNNPDYNYAIRTAPVSDLGAAYLHWYITIVPRISYAAGFEIGSGIYINPSLPEECAEYLRQVDDHVRGDLLPDDRPPDDTTPDDSTPPAFNGAVSDE